MDNIFGNDVSTNKRSKIIYHIFHNNHSFVDLNEVILTNNRIKHLRETTFCNVIFIYIKKFTIFVAKK